jgi:mannose-6-phosphate isomerase-like protein (cupin superfamily)
MIIRAGEAEVDIREEMRGGKGTVKILKHIPKDDMQGKCRLCATLYIQPGCSIGMHEHVDEYEIFIIQKGTGIINDNGKEYKVAKGDALLTGGGASHSIENTGDEEMEVTAIILT